MLPFDIHLNIARYPRSATRLGSGPVGLGANEIDGNRQLDLLHEVGQEEKGARGDPHEHDGRWELLEVVRNLRGEFGYSRGDFFLGPQNPFYGVVQSHGETKLLQTRERQREMVLTVVEKGGTISGEGCR